MKYPVVGLARALALWGTPSHDAGRRARSRGAPREGEGRRREGGVKRSERYLDGRGTMGKRAEVEHPLAASRLLLPMSFRTRSRVPVDGGPWARCKQKQSSPP